MRATSGTMPGRKKRLFMEHDLPRLAVAQPYHEERPAAEHHRVEGSTRRTRMPISYTNRKGLTYTLYRGQTRTGKPRYYFGRAGQGQGEPVTELPPGFTISESVNGVVSLVKEQIGRASCRERVER